MKVGVPGRRDGIRPDYCRVIIREKVGVIRRRDGIRPDYCRVIIREKVGVPGRRELWNPLKTH